MLRALADAEALEPAQLVQRAFLLRPSLVRILKDLQARGLVQRVASKASAKRSLQAITDKGRALLAETAEDTAAIQAGIERLYGAEALAELKRSLETLERLLTPGALTSLRFQSPSPRPGARRRCGAACPRRG